MNHVGMCHKCLHFDRESEDPVCTAFPGGVPINILSYRFDHREEYPGDLGVRFSPDETVTPGWLSLFEGRPGVSDEP